MYTALSDNIWDLEWVDREVQWKATVSKCNLGLAVLRASKRRFNSSLEIQETSGSTYNNNKAWLYTRYYNQTEFQTKDGVYVIS